MTESNNTAQQQHPPQAGDTLVAAALKVMLQPDPVLKAEYTKAAVQLWQSGQISRWIVGLCVCCSCPHVWVAAATNIVSCSNSSLRFNTARSVCLPACLPAAAYRVSDGPLQPSQIPDRPSRQQDKVKSMWSPASTLGQHSSQLPVWG